jgi:hypothetical protein
MVPNGYLGRTASRHDPQKRISRRRRRRPVRHNLLGYVRFDKDSLVAVFLLENELIVDVTDQYALRRSAGVAQHQRLKGRIRNMGLLDPRSRPDLDQLELIIDMSIAS